MRTDWSSRPSVWEAIATGWVLLAAPPSGFGQSWPGTYCPLCSAPPAHNAVSNASKPPEAKPSYKVALMGRGMHS